jgi:alcohol dehydrogenase class IV
MGNQFIMPKQVFYGENALKDAADVIATLGKKALVVTDPMMMKLGTAQMVTDLLDRFTRYIQPHTVKRGRKDSR